MTPSNDNNSQLLDSKPLDMVPWFLRDTISSGYANKKRLLIRKVQAGVIPRFTPWYASIWHGFGFSSKGYLSTKYIFSKGDRHKKNQILVLFCSFRPIWVDGNFTFLGESAASMEILMIVIQPAADMVDVLASYGCDPANTILKDKPWARV